MNNKIINTFKHGDAKTKTVLAVMIAGLLVSVALLVVSIVTFNSTLTFVSIILLLVDLAYIFGTDFSKEVVEREKREKYRAEKRAERERKKAEEDDDTPGALEWVSSDKEKAKDDEGVSEEAKKDSRDRDVPENPFDQYDDKYLKKVMYKYKVRQEHVMLLIDSCKKEKITECPGFLWKDKVYVYILLLESEPRMVKFPIAEFPDLKVRAGVASKPSQEYDNFKTDSNISRLYSSLLPNYTQGEDPRTHRTTYRKNLYGIGPDIWCTSNSVKNIMHVLSLNVVLTDSRTNSDAYGSYFREVYTARLMYRDGVLSGGEYKDQVLLTLSDLAANAEDDGEFIENLNQMQTNGLIPQEYVDYASQKRNQYKRAISSRKR